MDINLNDYDFIDFGASKGGSIEFAKAALGGRKGLGIDLDPKKVSTMKSLGIDAIQGDFTNLDLPKKSVKFVIMSHVLEHLPDLETVEKTLESAINLSTEFVFIQGPVFDSDKYLKSFGLKFYWSDWHGHTCHLTTYQLAEILSQWNVFYNIYVREKVVDSNNSALIPINSLSDQFRYDPKIHQAKTFANFPKPLYKEFVCIIKLNPNMANWDSIVKAKKEMHLLINNINV